MAKSKVAGVSTELVVELGALGTFIKRNPPHFFSEKFKTNNPSSLIYEELPEAFLRSGKAFGRYLCTDTSSGNEIRVYFIDLFSSLAKNANLHRLQTRTTKFASILFLATDGTLNITRTPDYAERLKHPFEE